MPLSWEFDASRQLVIAVCDGFVERHEVDALLDDMVAANVLWYRKIFDGLRGDTKMGAADVLAIGTRFAFHRSSALGPLAVVVENDKYPIIARVVGILAVAKRPMRLFGEVAPAVEWLMRQEVRAPAPP